MKTNLWIYTYSDTRVSLHYDEKLKKIIFDHLVPIETIYKDVRSLYGPDFTYDAFVPEKGNWILEENIDAKNKE